MLNFFRRRKRRPIDLGDDPLAIRDLLDHPALRELMAEPEAAADSIDSAGPAPVSLEWSRLMAAGPIRFDSSTQLDRVA